MLRINERLACLLALAIPTLCVAPIAQAAESWPGSKPIQLIVPYANGGSTDLVARQLADAVSKKTGGHVIVENRAGASGMIGSSYVHRQPADGYTLLLGTVTSHAIAPSVTANLPYDIVKDFTPITTIGTIPDLIVVNPNLGVSNLSEFIKLAQSRPEEISYASAGTGSSSHLGGAYFAAEAGLKLNHISYRGSGPALIDVLGGHVDMMLDVVMTSLEPVKAGRLKALAVTSKERSALLPDVPTVQESGIAGFEAIIWFALFAPANMDPALQTRIAQAFDETIQEPQMKELLLRQGITATGTGPAALAETVRQDTEKWRDIAQKAGVKPQ
ncbi:Bug family tripartite tricarboxylate transporter substrate binding protein [Bordetella tumulicola]|uniref:Bug family tripartite tricarboxylate transporter substrate binding protein n=1 Tax=Bordetella tumulicola TaxID=1649133 RepID=UPI0039F01F35